MRGREEPEKKWKELETIAKMKNKDFAGVIVPYSEDHIVGEYNGL